MALSTYLFAHSDKKGKNVAQTWITDSSYKKAVAKFTELYPDREITASGIQGKDS